MSVIQWFKLKGNPLHLAEDRVLIEQLRLIMSNVGNTVVPSMLLALSMVWALSNDGNTSALWIWCAVEIVSNLNIYRYSRRHLAGVISVDQVHRMVWVLVSMDAVHGLVWGVLSWIAMDTSDPISIVLIIAVATGMVGSALATTSAVPLVFVAFAFPLLGVIAAKLWMLGDMNYRMLGAAFVLYAISLFGQALNSARATRDAIEVRFKLDASQKQFHEIEQRQLLSQERQRLMQDMHDGMGSSLANALMVVERGRMDEAEVAQVLMGCIDDLKLAIDSMEPVEADLLLLLATLRYRLGPRLESTGIALRWEVKSVPKLDWLDPKNSLHILRILQEAFTNIIRHSHATEVRVTTRAESDHVAVTITDNGQGFDVECALKSSGKGLSNQKRRAEAIGAEVSWDSTDAGTCFTLCLPITRLSA